MSENKSFSLTGSTLKIIAIITMLIDHIGACIFELGILENEAIRALPDTWTFFYQIDRGLRFVGRVAFPIFCFLLVEGFLHTSNRKRYAFRLFLFSLISEIPFNLAIRGTIRDSYFQNVYFTLLIALLVMMACDYVYQKFVQNLENNPSTKLPFWLFLPIQLVIISFGMLLAYWLRTDYSYKGVAAIAILYLFRFDKTKQVPAGVLSFCWELPAPLAFIPIWFYNGKRGISLRWFFYWFYPVHLLLLWAFTTYLLPVLL